jgi:phosphatidylinositol glycan class Z
MYNMNPRNLALHGVHRPWTHLFVNLPLLYGLLPFVAMHKMFTSWLPSIGDNRPVKLDARVDYVMMAAFLFPVLFLSLFHHQEPRFLVPLLFPLVFVAHDQFFKHGIGAKALLVSWIVANGLLAYFYGVVHQAGVSPMLIYVSRNMHRRAGHRLHLVSTYSYPMPQFLLKNNPDSGMKHSMIL